MTKDQAIAAARRALPRWADGNVLEAMTGLFADLGDPYAKVRISPAPTPDQLVWKVNLGIVIGPLNASGTYAILDAFDGRVIQEIDWIS
jgi:hypothetical protein